VSTPYAHTLAERVLEDARPALTPAQMASVEQDLYAGEPLIALEFIAQFLTENDQPIQRSLYDRLSSSLIALGSERTKRPISLPSPETRSGRLSDAW